MQRAPNSESHPTRAPHDTTVKKVDSAHSPTGPDGRHYLAAGKRLAMRKWTDEPPGRNEVPRARDYETLGYVIAGKAVLHVEGQSVILHAGDCWLVPSGADHRYEILEPFTAIEATSPPARVEARDQS